MALVDTGAQCSRIYSKPGQFLGPSAHIDGYGSQTVKVKSVHLPLEIEWLLARRYTVYVSLIPEYILGISVLQGLKLQTSEGEFRLQAHVVKAVVRGYRKHSPQLLLAPRRVMALRQYHLPGGMRK